ncbi:MAG: amidase family protein [Dialister invisus]
MPREFFGEGIGEETKEAIKSALAYYEKEGAEIVDVSIPHITSGVDVYYIIAPAEASSNLARYDGVGFGYRASGKDIVDMYIKSRSTGFGEEVKRRIAIGNYVARSAGCHDAYYLTALKVRTLLKREFEKAFEQCDILAAPSASGTAFKFGAFSDPLALYMEDIYTVPVNLIGAPSISIPVGFKDGMPLGMRLIGPNARKKRFCRRCLYAFSEQDAST